MKVEAPSPRSPRRPPRGARQPCAAGGAVGAALERGALLGGIVGPARRQLLGLTDFFVARLGRARRSGGGRGARRPGFLVDRALDLGGRFAGSSGFLATSTFLGAFIISRMARASASANSAALGEIGSLLRFLVGHVGGLTTRSAGSGGSARLHRAQPAASAAAPGQLGLSRGGSQRRRRFRRPCAASWRRVPQPDRAFPVPPRWRRFSAVFLLAAQQLGLARFFLAAQAVRPRRSPARRAPRRATSSRLTKVRFLRTSTWMVRLAARVGLLDLAGRLFARQRDLLALGRRCRGRSAGSRADVPCRPRQHVVGRRLLPRRRLQLVSSSVAGRFSSVAKLGDGGLEAMGGILAGASSVLSGALVSCWLRR